MNFEDQAGGEMICVELSEGPLLQLGDLQLSLVGGGTGHISLG